MCGTFDVICNIACHAVGTLSLKVLGKCCSGLNIMLHYWWSCLMCSL